MKTLKSIIYYDENKVDCDVDVADDCIKHVNNLAPLIIKTDLILHKGKYKIIFGHGTEGWIYEDGEKILPMQQVSQKYDIMVACNNYCNKSIWKPEKGTRLFKGTYGIGKINLDLKRTFFFNDDGTQNPEGFTFFIGGNPFFDIKIEGNYQYGNRSSMFSDGIDVSAFCKEKNIKRPDYLVNVTDIQDLSESQDLTNKKISGPAVLIDTT